MREVSRPASPGWVRRAHGSRKESPGKQNGIDGLAKVLKCLIENFMGIKKKAVNTLRLGAQQVQVRNESGISR